MIKVEKNQFNFIQKMVPQDSFYNLLYVEVLTLVVLQLNV